MGVSKLIFLSLFLIFLFIFFATIFAMPFVFTPITFNVTNEVLVETSVFNLFNKIVIRVNVSDSENDTQYVWINLTASNGTLIYFNELMINTSISCGENCSIWEKNYTLVGGDPVGLWIINISANNTSGELASNSTTFNVNKFVEIIISPALSQGVSFGLVHPGSIGNPALNNSDLPNGGTSYNFTVGYSSNTNVSFYSKINETKTNFYLNESCSKTSNYENFSSNTTLTTDWKIIGDSSINCSSIGIGESCWIKYFLDVSNHTPSQYFEVTYYYCAIYEGGNPSLCE